MRNRGTLWVLAAVLAVFAAVPSAGAETFSSSEPGGILEADSEGRGEATAIFSEWEKTGETDYSYSIYERNITVSDGGTYLFTWMKTDKDGAYQQSFSVIESGNGRQVVYTEDMDAVEMTDGRFFRVTPMDECPFDVDQIMTDQYVTVSASSGSSFILVYRQKGGERDGEARAVSVMNGRRNISREYYTGMESVDLLGVFLFQDGDRDDLVLSANVISPSYTTYMIQQFLASSKPDGIGILKYSKIGGDDVCVIQPVLKRVGVFTVYDSAEAREDISIRDFEVIAFSSEYADVR